jgi:hypothetical protein
MHGPLGVSHERGDQLGPTAHRRTRDDLRARPAVVTLEELSAEALAGGSRGYGHGVLDSLKSAGA